MAVTIEHEGHIAVVTIDRADRANAIDLDTAKQLSEAFDELAESDNVRAVVLTGAGDRVFCAGMDLEAVQAGLAADINGVSGGFAGIVRRSFPKPLIGAINGAALGGGFEIALACDVVVAATNARFGLPEVSRGLFAASGGAVRMSLRLPAVIAAELVLVGEPIDAARALTLGLVNRVVPEGTACTWAAALAARIATGAPLAVQASIQVLRTAQRSGEDAAWSLNDRYAALVTNSIDAGEGALAARERRTPVWVGR